MGTMRKGNGTYTETRLETLELMAQTHFPGNKTVQYIPINGNEVIHSQPNCEDWKESSNIFTTEKIRWAMHSFKPYKSAGNDDIFPALLQKGESILLPILRKIFRASHAWAYIPKAWRMAKIIYIPKAGKRPSDQPKSYRPISLTSFLLKTMEKILDQDIRYELLLRAPLHPMQFAYQPGKSTVHALLNVTKKIEKSIRDKEIALGIFLDIEGAFDNTGYEIIYDTVTRRGIKTSTAKWIKNMLTSRSIISTIDEEILVVQAAKGCPQGGVLSPLLWSLIVDDLLIKLNESGIEAQGYADDVVLLVRGKFESTVADIAQRALNIVVKWCRETNLSINPKKTTIVAFTNRKVRDKLKKPSLMGEIIDFSKEVKFLGVTLDEKLNWNAHIKKALEKARVALWTCRSMCGKNCGLNPKMALWLYTAIRRPTLTYASALWWQKSAQVTAQKELNKLQRSACLWVTGAMRTTSTASLEALLHLEPLHLFIQKEALVHTYKCIIGDDPLNKKNAHQELVNELMTDETLAIPLSDHCLTRYNFEKPFKIVIPAREQWETSPPTFSNGALVWYTDGSKTNEGVGAGVYGKSLRAHIHSSLDCTNSVFQAEVHAIELCVRENLRRKYKKCKIYILSDSRAALLALNSHSITSKLVWDCVEVLKTLGKTNNVTIMWVPGHTGIAGNEAADYLARKGSTIPFTGPSPFCGIPLSTAKMQIKTWLESRAENYWANLPGNRQTKMLLPTRSQKKTKELLCFTRGQIHILVGIITGHYHVKKHLHRIGLAENNLCRICEMEEESIEHLLCECVGLSRKRLNYLGTAFPEKWELPNIPFKNILSLICNSGIHRDSNS